jgi:4a-hydroxytetrahydrobiopterin dehydratase
MPRLTASQARQRMKAVPQWAKRASVIRRKFVFAGFVDAVGFVNRVARAAERSDHHPDINIRWNKVTLALSTHSEGGLTGKDFSMARKCDDIFSRHFCPPGR